MKRTNQGVIFKILLLTFKALMGMAPAYISELINVIKHERYSLRSNSGTLLLHPAGKIKKSFGDRSFSVAAPTLWDMFPASLRNIDSILTFKSCLKTHLFKLAFSLKRLNYFIIVKFSLCTYLVHSIIIYIQKFLQSDWWRASQFIQNAVQKCEIECRKLKLVQKR